MITSERIAALRAVEQSHGYVVIRDAEALAILDAAESALEMMRDMAKVDFANRRVEDVLGYATDDTRAIRDIAIKWLLK